jgi:hypothetical protein
MLSVSKGLLSASPPIGRGEGGDYEFRDFNSGEKAVQW